MSTRTHRLRICALLMIGCASAQAIELPAVCNENPLPLDETTPIASLRERVEALNETEPTEATRLLCMAIPRVERELGPDSAELAWWIGALATPLIAYMNQYAEAIPLLEVAQPLLERHYGAQGAEVADIHVAYAWIYYRQGKLADAAAAWQRALAIREQHPGVKQIELQKALVGLALVRQSQGQFAAARAALHRAQDILRAHGEQVSEAAAAIENVLTNIAFREEDYLAAKRHALAQIEIEKQLARGIGQFVPAYVFLGQILERLDDYEGSEAASKEAIRLAESDEGPLQRHTLTALTQLAVLLNERGRPEEALDYARRAVQLGETTLGVAAPRLIRSLQALADIHRTLGQLPEAWRLYQRIGAIVEQHRADIERPVLVAYHRGFAGLHLELGSLDEAAAALEAGLAAASEESSLTLERAYLLATLGRVNTDRNPAQSTAHFSEALELFRSRVPDSHPAILRVINERCAGEIAADASASSCEEARTRAARTREAHPALRAAVLGNLSELAQLRGESEQAVELAIASVAAAEGLGAPDPLWRAYYRTARALAQRGESRLAIFFGKRSIGQIERLRERFVGEDRRFDRGYLRDKVAVYRRVADWLMEAGRIDEGLEVMRLLKAEELYEFVARDAAFRSDGAALELAADERRLADRYSEALPETSEAAREIERLSRLADRDRLTPEERRRLERLLRRHDGAEAGRARRIREFVAENSGQEAAPSSSRGALTAARLQDALEHAPPNAAVAVYLLAEGHLRLVVATRRSQSELRIDIDTQRLQRDIGRFIERIGQREDVSALSRALYDQLGRPLDEAARREGVTHLVLWLDGALRYLPFYALATPEGYLGERYAIQMLASTSPGATANAASSEAEPIVRGLGLTQGVAGFAPLPAMADELCSVVRGPIAGLATRSDSCPDPSSGGGALAGEGYADAAFTAQRLETMLAGARDFSVLHLGTHFSLRPGNALRSFLLLGDGSRLMLDRFGSFDFSGLELVTLSACQTALGGARTDDGREIDGLNAIVQQRGARRVVASLWRVDDASTALLMREMYRALAAEPDDVARALRQAQQTVRMVERDGRRPYEHPYYWAGFVLSDSGA